MADITIKSVKVGRFRKEDFGPEESGRFYYVEYDIPGMPHMNGHVHTIPALALANHRINVSEHDPLISMEYFLKAAMTTIQTFRVLGQRKALTLASSPVVKAGMASRVMAQELETTVVDLADSVSGATPQEVTEEVGDTVILGEATSKLLALAPEPAETAVSRLVAARGLFLDTQDDVLSTHPVDTSVKPWATLRQMLADDLEEIGQVSKESFDARYGGEIRLRAGYRLLKERKNGSSV